MTPIVLIFEYCISNEQKRLGVYIRESLYNYKDLLFTSQDRDEKCRFNYRRNRVDLLFA